MQIFILSHNLQYDLHVMEEAAGPEARQMFPVKESEHGSETGNGLRMHPATTIGEDDNSTNGRVLSSTSSSCSSSSGDPFELDADEISKPCAGDIGVPKHSENAQAPLEDYHNEIPDSFFCVLQELNLILQWNGVLLQMSNQHPVNKSTEVGPKISNVNEHLGGETDRPKAAETMRGVAKEDEEDGNKERSLAKGSLHSASPSLLSDASGESVKSFAFPILTGDDKSYSLSHKQYPSSRPQTPRSAQSSRVQQESKRLSEPEPEPEPVPKENLNMAPGVIMVDSASLLRCYDFCRDSDDKTFDSFALSAAIFVLESVLYSYYRRVNH
ncbi:hypothetical protein OIU78_016990 [Salix suchowensis]|nr:hypothetical protein OIU78_016990 [Salix suchowensis]